MGADSLGQAVVHRFNFYLGLKHPEAAFNVGQCLVALHHFWRRQIRHVGQPSNRPVLECLPILCRLLSFSAPRVLGSMEATSIVTRGDWMSGSFRVPLGLKYKLIEHSML
jgi:hypothetical protein